MSSRGNFADVLRRLREQAGLTQQELAERADLTPHAVSSLERGTRTRPYPHTVRSLADALGATEAERAELLAAVPRRGRAAPTAAKPAGIVVPPTQLHGRSDDLVTLTDLVRSGERLVTLTGPGGVGKTRLVAALSDVLGDDYADGVVQVSLAPVLDASAVLPTVGRALGLTGADGEGAYDVVAAHLQDLQVLLVLDNLEHLLSAAPHVGRLVASCPGLAVLVTSRSPLRVRAEHEYVVEPLALPAWGTRTLEELGASAAGALVVDRLTAVSRHPVDVPACVELCHRLSGLPLAIELATAHLRALPARALLDRLEETLATSGARDLPERQRTMRTTLDWSYGLLDERQQSLFTLLGAFRGGATLEAVEAVAGEPVLGTLTELVEHSLVVARADRFVMLEPVAQYARSQLLGDRALTVYRAHAEFFAGFVEQAAAGFERSDQVTWLERTDADEANILVAVERAVDAGEATTAARLVWYLWLYWWLRGQVTLGRRLAEECLKLPLGPWERGRVHLTGATMSYAVGDTASAAEHWSLALDLAVADGDREVIGKARAGVGLAALADGDLDEAEKSFRDALEYADRGDWLSSLTHVWLGTIDLLRGYPASAVPEIELGLAASRARGDRLTTYVALYNLSQAALALGDPGKARAHLDEGIALSQETRDLANLAYFIETLAVVEATADRHERVALLLGASTGLRETVGADVYAYYLPDEAARAGAHSSALAALGEDAFADAFDSGKELELAQVVTLAAGS
ncbi:MAG TPA: helix-turn-helix domain-containing protein [Nocardioidaceae bacterium]|nr:helix-turn-helix domain-containing protein [Nocardioidaceae bacterium]